MLSVRRARSADMELYFRWANDPVTRANSWNNAKITLEAHERWFAGQLAESFEAHYVVEMNGIPAGQVRLTLSGEEALIGFSVDPEHRGRGLGGKVLQAALKRFAEERTDVRWLKALVRSGNSPSKRIFAELGFNGEEDGEARGMVYRLDLSRLRMISSEGG